MERMKSIKKVGVFSWTGLSVLMLWLLGGFGVCGEDEPAKPRPEGRDQGDVIEIRATTVKAAHEAGSFDRERRESVVPITGIDRKTLKERPNREHLGNVLNRLPGVSMGGTPEESKDIRLRGMDKEFSRFELDGIQLPGGGEKREFRLNRLSPIAFETIKIVRNPTAEYESDGIAGRVVTQLRPVPRKFQVELYVSVAAVDALDHLRWGREGGHFSLGVGDRVSESVGYNVFVDAQRIGQEKDKRKEVLKADGSLKEFDVEEEKKPIASSSLLGDFVWFYGPEQELHLRPLYLFLRENKELDRVKNYPGKSSDEEFENEIKEQESYGLTVLDKHGLGGGFDLESAIDYVVTAEDKDKDKTAYKAGVFNKWTVEDEDKKDRFWQVRQKLTIPWDPGIAQEWKVGYAWRDRHRQRDKSAIEYNSAGIPSDKTKPQDNYIIDEFYGAAFIQDEIFFSDSFSVMPGVRGEAVKRLTKAGDATSGEDIFHDLNPSLHILWRITPDLSIKAAGSRTVNRPKFDQLAPYLEDKGSYYFQGNPSLEPARAWNFDLGFEWHGSACFFAATLFYKRLHDVIEEFDSGLDSGGKDVYTVMNNGDGWLKGIELEERFDLSAVADFCHGLTIWSNQSFYDSLLETPAGSRRPVSQQPDWLINAGFDYQPFRDGPILTVAAKFIDDLVTWKDDGSRDIEDPPILLDLAIRQKMTSGTDVFFEIHNALNDDKEKTKITATGESEYEREHTGRTFLFGLEMTF